MAVPHPSRKRVLVAVRPEDAELSLDILQVEFELILSHTLTDAVAKLETDIDVILCGMHFDDGNVFELLRSAKSRPDTAPTPFIIILGVNGARYSSAILNGIHTAARLMGATEFIDMARLIQEQGVTVTREQIRRSVREAS